MWYIGLCCESALLWDNQYRYWEARIFGCRGPWYLVSITTIGRNCMTGWETLKMWAWDDHDWLGLSDLSDMTVWHECASREHTSVHDQYRERDDVMFEDSFEDRVMRNCPKNRSQGWGEPGRLKWTTEWLGWVGWAALVGWWPERRRWPDRVWERH